LKICWLPSQNVVLSQNWLIDPIGLTLPAAVSVGEQTMIKFKGSHWELVVSISQTRDRVAAIETRSVKF
jgi:hypothetical protein